MFKSLSPRLTVFPSEHKWLIFEIAYNLHQFLTNSDQYFLEGCHTWL